MGRTAKHQNQFSKEDLKINLFEQIKIAFSTVEIAEHYGIEVNHNGMALCPFHNDHHPSLFVADDHYYCFGCGEHGDSINLVAKLYNLPLYEAAKKLAVDFGLTPGKLPSTEIQENWKKKNKAHQLRENEKSCFRYLNEYHKLLEHWMNAFAPTSPEDTVDDHFAEACHLLALTEYYLDLLIMGDSCERTEVVQMMLRDNRLEQLKAHVTKARKEETHHVKQEIR